MTAISYRFFFDNKPAPTNQLDSIDEITVEQEVDMAWEARIKIPIAVDDKGHWTAEDDDFMKSFSRVRFEIKVKDDFIPLIDGPIVGFDRPTSSEPGQSFVNLIVNDDSVYLNQEEKITKFENIRDDEIVTQIFDSNSNISSTDIQVTTQKSPFPTVIQRGTDMHLLRILAKRNGMHAYVLPGDTSGQSIGCFKPFPIEPDGLTALKLLGTDMNITTFNVTDDSTRPSNVKAFYLNMNDKSISEYDSSYTDADMMGTDSVLENGKNVTLQILNPYQNLSEDPEQVVVAIAENSSYAFEATGKVLENYYQDVLQPYRAITVLGVNARLSGDYLISKVTHKLNRTSYSQSFTVRRNARSAGSGSGSDNLLGMIS